MPTSVNARLNANRFDESVGSGWVEAISVWDNGKLVNRANAGAVGSNTNEYICVGRKSIGLKPSDSTVGTVPSGLIF